MSFAQVLDKLPGLTVAQRQTVIRRAMEIDDGPLSEADARLVASRLAEHHRDPSSSVPLVEFKARLRRRRS